MKTYLVIISALTPFLCAASDTNGFLVFKIDRLAYSTRTNGNVNGPEIEQAFKVPLTPEFLSNFKHLPSQNSEGTGFCCSGHIEKIPDNDVNFSFMWWLERTSDHRWYIHMWGFHMNPAATQSVTIRNLEDLDMSYQASYEHMPTGGVNVQFSAKYMSADEMRHQGPIPTASVTRADRSELFKGDSLTNCPAVLRGLFQEN